MDDHETRSALAPLAVLLGEWTMQAVPPGGPPWPGEGRVNFEWLDGEAFLIQRWTVDLPEAPDGIAIIGAGEEPGRLRQHYFDSRGVHRIYEMTFTDGTWRMWRDAAGPPGAQRFSAEMSADGRTISGRWEIAPDGQSWRTDFDLAYRKVA